MCGKTLPSARSHLAAAACWQPLGYQSVILYEPFSGNAGPTEPIHPEEI
jgi:hypothetical protein